MKKRLNPKFFLLIFVNVFIFWGIDFVLHYTGVGETGFYYFSKFANAILFSFIWFAIFNFRKHWARFLFAVVFGTWISFYYLIASYSGLVQYFGIYALYTPPVFMIFGKIFSPVIWWFVHIFAFYLGLESASWIKRKL